MKLSVLASAVQTIKQWVFAYLLDYHQQRRKRLKALHAPDIMLEQTDATIAQLKDRSFKIRGMDKVGSLRFTKVDHRKGRGGKPFIAFTTKAGEVLFFQRTRFGMWIKLRDDEATK